MNASFSARAAATTRVITRCSAPRRPAAALRGPPPRPAAGSRPAPADVKAAAAPAAPPARFPIPAGRGPPRSKSGAALLGEAAAREPWSGLGQRRWGRERLRAQGSGSGRGSGSVRACARECQSRPRPRHRQRGVEAERPRVNHGGRPYWKRAGTTGSGRWPARGGARPWAPPTPRRHLGSAGQPSAPHAAGRTCSADSRRPTAPPARRSGDGTTPTRHAARRQEEGGGPGRQDL